MDTTGIEPVTPSMSTRCSPAELRVHEFILPGVDPEAYPRLLGGDCTYCKCFRSIGLRYAGAIRSMPESASIGLRRRRSQSCP